VGGKIGTRNERGKLKVTRDLNSVRLNPCPRLRLSRPLQTSRHHPSSVLPRRQEDRRRHPRRRQYCHRHRPSMDRPRVHLWS